MGLGAARKRSKLSNDPNNTTWSRSDTKYGQKILQSQGWAPDDLLGASGTTYSNLHSAASATHIRITLKDDNLGLGAKRGAVRDIDETTGLDVFQGLLNRLNGTGTTGVKDDRLQRSDLRSSAYIDQRWGYLRFVSGGLLVGDLRDLAVREKYALNESLETSSHDAENVKLLGSNRSQSVQSNASKRKKRNKRKILGDGHSGKETGNGVDQKLLGPQSSIDLPLRSEGESQSSSKNMCDQLQSDKVRRQAERVQRKLNRQVKMDSRHATKVRGQSSNLTSPDLIPILDSDMEEVAVASPPHRVTNATINVSNGLGAGRHAVRHRNIQHKKMCMVDNKALNEILMIRN